MGKCSKCGKKIVYNKYVMYQGRVFCNPCNIARLLKEATDKEKAKEERAMKKILKSSKKAKKAVEDEGIQTFRNMPPIEDDDDDNEEGKTAENTR